MARSAAPKSGGDDDLFGAALQERLQRQAPLAARLLPRTLDGARAQVSRLNERRVAELCPSGPGSAAGQPG